MALLWRDRTPQVLANEGYRQLWLGRLAGPSGAIREFQMAAEADAAFPYRWSDLGLALADAGRLDEARVCFLRSLELGPKDPQLALRAANFYFRVGETKAALELGSRILRQVPDYDDMIFSSWIRMARSGPQTWDSGIGSNGRAAEAFFRFEMRAADENTLKRAWEWMGARGFATRDLARSWAQWLIAHRDPGEGARVWASRVTRDPESYRVSNWVDDPGFEAGGTGEGFGWRMEACPGVKVGRDPAVKHAGQPALRLAFEASENLDFHHVSQLVWLDAGRYRLSGWVRTENFTTDRGVGVRLVDTTAPGLDVSTAALTGTNDWTPVSAEFSVEGRSRLAALQIVRQPSWKFDNEPHGTAWVAGVELAKVH